MGKVVYLLNLSLDGFIEGADGTFGWGAPSEEVHLFHNELASTMGAFVYGRRMYETMAVWQTLDSDPSTPPFMAAFARTWRSKPKYVFSKTLASVGEGCTLLRGDVAAEITRLKGEISGDLSVSGAGLGTSLAHLDLIDEYRLVLCPVLVGAGKSYFPALPSIARLRLLETRAFGSGAVYLRYELDRSGTKS